MSHIKTGSDLQKEAYSLGTGLATIFVDDIQAIPNFEESLHKLSQNKNLTIIITFAGNFKLCTSEEALKKLDKIFFTIQVHPAKFGEMFNEIEEQTWKRTSIYFSCGGLPFLTRFSTHEDCKEYLSVVCKGLAFSNPSSKIKKVRNPEILYKVLESLALYTGQAVSAGIIVQSLKKQGLDISVQGAIDYLKFAEQLFIIHKVRCVEFSGKEEKHTLTSGNRYYFEDLGIRAYFADKLPANEIAKTNSEERKNLKNATFLYLLEQGWQITTGRTKSSSQVDFVCTRQNGSTYEKIYVQCVQEIPEKRFSSPAVLDYDAVLSPLLAFKDGWKKYLVTLEPENLIYRGITCVSFQKLNTILN